MIKKAAPTGEDRGRYSEYLDLLRYALSDISPKQDLLGNLSPCQRPVVQYVKEGNVY